MVAKPFMVATAPAVGSTEMRYSGISLLSTVDSATKALWPELPTGGVPHFRSLGWACDQAIGAVIPAASANTPMVLRIRLSMDISPFDLRFSATAGSCGCPFLRRGERTTSFNGRPYEATQYRVTGARPPYCRLVPPAAAQR